MRGSTNGVLYGITTDGSAILLRVAPVDFDHVDHAAIAMDDLTDALRALADLLYRLPPLGISALIGDLALAPTRTGKGSAVQQ
jgi:hypothetical protein